MKYRIAMFLVCLTIAVVGFGTFIFGYLTRTESFRGTLVFEGDGLCRLGDGTYLDPAFCRKNQEKEGETLEVVGVREPLEYCKAAPEGSGSCISVLSSEAPQ